MRGRRGSRTGSAGFTLLEMMIAVGVLAVALIYLVEATSQAISAANHAKLVTTATFLARVRLGEVEDALQDKGFTDDAFAKEDSGDFGDQGFKRFRWSVVIDKVELPATDQVQSLVSKALTSQQTAGGSDPTGGLGGGADKQGGAGALGAGASALSSQFNIIKDVLEQSIRRVKVVVSWDEQGQPKSIEVVEYLTDPRRVDQNIQVGLPGGGGLPGGAGAPGGGAGAPGGGAGAPGGGAGVPGGGGR